MSRGAEPSRGFAAQRRKRAGRGYLRPLPGGNTGCLCGNACCRPAAGTEPQIPRDAAAPQGRKLLSTLGPANGKCSVIMDTAYEGNAMQQLCREPGYLPVVPPNSRRLKPWDYDRELYKKRNEVERLFRRLKDFRRVFTRYGKLDVMYLAFVVFALIVAALK